jgi:hypothetical protein
LPVLRLGLEKRDKFLVFGNPIVAADSTPLRIIGKLRERFPGIEFREFDPNENLENEGRNLNIIDTIEGIDRVMLITDIASIKTQRVYSMHDFDLGHALKILKRLNYIDGVRIFGVPMGMGEKEALVQLTAAIRSNLF